MAEGEVTPPPRKVLIISAGASHSVALLSGEVVCSWGRGEDGQLGHGDAEDRSSPTQLSALDEHQIVSVTCGADHTVAYSQSRLEVYSWGWGDFGRLGHGNSSDLFTPLPIKALHGVMIKQIACGDSHCLAVTMDGEVQSWGRNQNGQLGLGNTEDSLVPQKIQAFEGIRIKMVAAGAEHTAAVTEDGDLYGWDGKIWKFGISDRNDRLFLKEYLCCVRDVDGAVMQPHISFLLWSIIYLWMEQIWPTRTWRLGGSPCFLTNWKRSATAFFSQISGGWRHTMPLTSDGKLYGWGWNKFGQVGVGNNLDQCSPVQVRFPDDQKVVQVSCGWRHTLAVTERNNVFAWGRGTNGQLGIGESLDRNSPNIIEALSVDGASGQHIESSSFDPSSGKSWVSPSERYAVVPGETGQTDSTSKGNGGDISVPQTDAKRVRL
ncbi:ultraviolet-B receptor UVR8 [Brassica rapa]|uniref:UVB-resistance 8 n=1 Tax=Brassica campestris TaxID=3711 RepID=A8IXS6_BRACM|nr:ultraviolet-B receptor UVR8 [Brassica rapa]ABV89648.1 UVB-resistance 8 [Brassica rapa]